MILPSSSVSGANHFSNADFISSNVNFLNSAFGSGCSVFHFSTKAASSLNGVCFNLTLTDDLLYCVPVDSGPTVSIVRSLPPTISV